MNRADLIAELEQERVDRELTAVAAIARIHGIDAQLESLRAGVRFEGDLASLPRTEAILTVLRSAKKILSPTEVLLQLNAGGRTDDRQNVTSTLKYLLGRDLVRKPSRGHYFAA